MSYGRILSWLNYPTRYVHRLFSSLPIKEVLGIENLSPNIRIRNNDTSQRLPLIVLFGWGDGKHKQLARYYSEIFEKKDFTTICLTSSLMNTWFRFNTEGRKESLNVKDILEELTKNDLDRKVIFYAFSFSGMIIQHMLLAEIMKFNLFQRNNIKGMIFDSPPIMDEESVRAVIDISLQNVTNTTFNFLLKAFFNMVCYAFRKSNTYKELKILMNEMGHYEIKSPPQLFLFSKNDKVARYQDVLDGIDAMEKSGVQVTYKLWDDSKHVGHMQMYKEEYVETVETFVDKCLR